jgi:hypothetical protein
VSLKFFVNIAGNVLGLTQSGPGTSQAGEIGYLALSSQFTPAVELKQTQRARIVPSHLLAAKN